MAMNVCNFIYVAALLMLAKLEDAHENISIASCATSAICENDGACVSHLGCFCKAGYSGNRCQIGPDCSDGWVLKDSRCFRYFAPKVSWNEAKRTCESNYSRLVSMSNLADVNFVINLVKNATNKTSSVWIDEWSLCHINASVSINTGNSSVMAASEKIADYCNDTTAIAASCRDVTASTNISVDSYCTAMSYPQGNCLNDSCAATRSFVCFRGLGCDSLSPPLNGSSSSLGHGVGYGETVTFSCNNSSGMVLEGSSSRECSFDGSWSGTKTICTKLLTKRPTTITPSMNATKVLTFTTTTYISLLISLAGYVLTIMAYAAFTGWLTSIHNKSVFCLSLFVTATLVLFIANGPNRSSEAECIATTVLLHFFWLFTSIWILVDGVAIILALKGREDSEMPKFIFRAFMIVFCVSSGIVLLTMDADFDNTYYRNQEGDFCGPAGLGLEYAVLTPVIIFLITGCVVFVAACVYLVMKFNSLSSSQKRSGWLHVTGGILQTILLFVIWVDMAMFISAPEDYAYDTRNSAQEVLQVTAPLLGIQTFVFHCLLHPKTIGAVKTHLQSRNKKKCSSPTPEVDSGQECQIAVNAHALEPDNKTDPPTETTSSPATAATHDTVMMNEFYSSLNPIAEV